MGVVKQIDITGAKGGSTTPKSPTEATDSLRSTNLAKLLIAVGEGEFDGVPTAKNIYLDNTPIEDGSGNVNFPNVKWEWRTGSVDQSYIAGIPSVENETAVNVELRNDAPWVRSITNTLLSAARIRLAWPSLQQQDDEGNVGGYRIEYAIDVATDGGAYQQVLVEAVDGKTTTRYERSRRIDLPAATTGWQIRVRRITANQNTNKIVDTMLVAGLTEVIDEKLRYPNTALLYIEFDAEQFTNIPAVTVGCKARKWQVPSNYDPVARTYSGVWDGTFKEAWTNNAAWATFGICTEDRFGLGRRIKSFMVDKWELYRIAQYCDQMVLDGVGGLEPRYLCDMNIQAKAEAWGLLRDISAIYRGMTYWAQGQLVTQADMPRAQDFDYVFTRSNVIDGKFSYGSASSKTRYTRAIVSFDNPANNYDTDVVAYSDLPLQRRFGDKPVEISAIGCTRASEAQRRGKWVVLTNNFDRTVSFKTGMEGAIPLPGYIIPIADSLLAGREIGGRISAVTGRVVTLDRDTQAKAGDRLIINLPSGKAEARTVQSVAGRAVTVTTAYSETPVAQLQWAIDADDLAIPLYRVMSTKRTTEGDYEITALQYEPSKFAAIDTGARLEERPISVIPITVVPAPASVTLTSTSAVSQGIAVTTMTIAWPAVSGAVAYDVEWRKDNGNWISVQRTGMTNVDITGIYSGGYLARVRAVSAYDITSVWKSSNLTQLNGKEGLPPLVTSLTTTSLLFGIGLKWTFPAGAEDTQRTEIWYSQSPTLETATKLADLSYPQSDYSLQQLKAAITLFFWTRLVDRSGNVGPWYPAGNGVAGQTSSDADAILDLLVGEITESQLGQELLSDIQTGGSGPGSISERLNEITGEIDDLGDQSIAIRDNLQSQITSVNGTLTSVKNDLQGQITAANTNLTSVKNNLQGQIDAVKLTADALTYVPTKTYAVGDTTRVGQRLYQALQAVPVNTSPPNATYWLDVGSVVVSANGLAARVTTAETKITNIEGVNTAQATSITGLTTSLATTNGNVTTAQNAANAANTLAGGKGKVLYQTATPAAADQLLQNLWIDITGGANTPKRWNGSAWAAVTDKAATDAAAAAASALAQVATKAEASAVSSLTTRVTQAEGTITAQGDSITGLTTAIAGKADSTTVTNLSNTVMQQGTAITAQGTAITGITASLGDVGGQNLFYNPSFDYLLAGGSTTIADGFAVGVSSGSTGVASVVPSTLDTKGKAQRLDITTTASSYVDLTTSGARRPVAIPGQSIMLSIYFRATAGLAVRMYMQTVNSAGATFATRTGATVVATGEWQRITLDYANLPANTVSINSIFRAGGALGGSVLSGFVEWDRAQLQLGTVVTGWQDNATTLATDVAANATATTSLTGRVSTVEGTVTSQGSAITTLQNALPGKADASAVTALTTRVTTAEGTLSSQGSAITSLTNTVNGKADASTVSTLSNTVTTQGNTITAQGTTITGITASLGDIGGQNLLFNPSFDALGTVAGTANGWNHGTAGGAVRTPTLITSSLDTAGKAQRFDCTALNATSAYAQMYLSPGRLPPCIENQTVAGSVYVRGTAGFTARFFLEFWDVAASALIQRTTDSSLVMTGDWQRLTRIGTAPAGTGLVQVLIRMFGTASVSAGFFEFDRAQIQLGNVVSGWQDNTGVIAADVAAQATATTALTGRVTTVEGTVSTQSSQITALTNNLTNSGGDNLLPNSSFEELATATRPKNWTPGGSVSWVDSVVASPLTSSVNAYRLSATAAAVGATLEARYNTGDGLSRPKVTGGNTYTLSSFVRGSTGGFRIAMYMQFMNAAGTVISTPSLAETLVTGTFTRYTLTGVAPALAVSVNVYAVRIFNRTAAAADMFVEVDNVQFQEGPVATAYSPSIKIALDAQSAATAALTSQVTQQGTDITSASTRVTNLENSVNNATTGLATKASSAALDSLTSTVTTQGTNITSATNRVTTLENSVNNASTGLATKASSTALNSLSGTVTTQGNTITSQGTAITNLANTVNSTTDGLATKASAAALTAVTSRVTAVEGVNTSQSTSITNLTNSINSIQGDLSGAELDAAPGANWNFDGSLDSWFGQNAAVGIVAGTYMRVTSSSSTNPIFARGALAIDGSLFNLVRMKITRRTNTTTDWIGAMYYATAGHGVSSSYYKIAANPNLAANQSAIVEWDMSTLTAGGTDWTTSLINTIRFDLGKNTDSVFDIDWVVVGRKGPGASSQALASLSSTVTQQGATLTSQASQITNLNATVGNQGVAIQTQATAIADTAGKVSGSYVVKMQAMTDGRLFAAGFALGLDNSAGPTQSQFIVSADRFGVLNADLNGTVTSPFIIEGGQVFMSDAVIKKATITDALIGSTINSQTFTSYGQPVMSTDYNAGMITIQNKATQGRYMLVRDDGIFMVSGGVIMIELSMA